MTELNLFKSVQKLIKSDFGYCRPFLGEEQGLEMYFISKRNKITAIGKKHESDKPKFKVSDF